MVTNTQTQTACIFNGADARGRNIDLVVNAISEDLVNEFSRRGWDAESLPLRDMRIDDCDGCFDCWVRTPGICRFNDDGRKTTMKAIRCDVLVFLSPVTFGGYGSPLKKAVDRLLSNLSPLFMKINGEAHHRPRYESYPRLIGLGVLEKPDPEGEAIFKKLVERNALNYHCPAHVVQIAYVSDPHDTIVKKIDTLIRHITEPQE